MSDERFEKIDRRFDRVDQRFKQIDQRFEQIDQRFEQVDQRFEQIDQRFEQVDQRFVKVEASIEHLRGDMNQGFEALRVELKTHAGVLHEEVLSRIAALSENRKTIQTKVDENLRDHREEIDRRVDPLTMAVRSHSATLRHHRLQILPPSSRTSARAKARK